MIPFILIGVVVLVIVFLAIAWYRIVPPSEAHLVVTPNKRFVASSDENIGTRTTYFAIPPSIPFFGRRLRIMDVTIKELIVKQETYEKDQARYMVTSSLKYRITDVIQAAETFINNEELMKQLEEIVKASVRAITVKYDVVQARAQKEKMSDEIQAQIVDDLKQWGLRMVNFVLVDFQDVQDREGKIVSSIISDISKRREVEIETETRQMNAEKYKQARTKEAEADEVAQKREIQRDEEVGKRTQNKEQKIAEEQKLAEEKRLDVVKVQQVKTAEIQKEKAIVEANQDREVEAVRKEQKKLEGEGDRDRAIEQAKGEAAPIREKGLAEAEAKEAQQAALNKFGDEAIRALIAEQVVQMQLEVGKANAKALENADMRIFAGGGADSQSGFDMGRLMAAMQVSNDGAAASVLNRLGRPNDLGLAALNSFLDKGKKSGDVVEAKAFASPKKKVLEVKKDEVA